MWLTLSLGLILILIILFTVIFTLIVLGNLLPSALEDRLEDNGVFVNLQERGGRNGKIRAGCKQFCEQEDVYHWGKGRYEPAGQKVDVGRDKTKSSSMRREKRTKATNGGFNVI